MSVATLVVALAFTAAACGGDDDDESAPTLCDDVEALQSSVTDLKNVDVVANGVSALETAVSDVTTNVETVVESASDEFSDEVDALQESMQALGTGDHQRRLGRDRRGQQRRHRRRNRGDEPRGRGRKRAVRLS